MCFIPNKEGNKRRIPITVDDNGDDDGSNQKTFQEATSAGRESVSNTSSSVEVDVTLTKAVIIILSHDHLSNAPICIGHTLRVYAEMEFCAQICRVTTTCCITQASFTSPIACL